MFHWILITAYIVPFKKYITSCNLYNTGYIEKILKIKYIEIAADHQKQEKLERHRTDCKKKLLYKKTTTFKHMQDVFTLIKTELRYFWIMSGLFGSIHQSSKYISLNTLPIL